MFDLGAKATDFNAARRNVDSMREKIDRLESFVSELRRPTSVPHETQREPGAQRAVGSNEVTPHDSPTQHAGTLRISDTGSTQFIGPSHWESILDDLEDVKAYFNTSESTGEDAAYRSIRSSDVTSIDIHLGVAQTYTKEQLLALMPPKQTMDRLIAAWFNALDPLRLIVHAPTFQTEYQRMWLNLTDASPSFLALIFSMACLGAEVSVDTTADPSLTAQAEDMRRLTAHSLVLAQYALLPPYIIETLLLHIKGLLLKEHDITYKTYTLLGLATRLSTLGGYHRDPSHNQALSPLHAEMRRRVWWMIATYDIIMCYQLGQLSVVNQLMKDTRPPSNLRESDLNLENVRTSRPMTENTPMTFMISFGKLTSIFGDVVYSSHTAFDASKVEALYERLFQARNDLPPQLQMVSVEQSFLDSPEAIMHRYSLEILHQKAICILYRRALSDPNSSEARSRCLNSAQKIIKHIIELLETGWPIGHFAASVMSIRRHIHDFVFVAMLLCLELKFPIPSSSRGTSANGEDWSRTVKEQLLKSCQLWEKAGVTWPKARHALRAIERFVHPYPTALDGLNSSVYPSAGSSHPPSLANVKGVHRSEIPRPQAGILDNFVGDATSEVDMQLFSSTDMEALGPAHEWDSLFRDVFGPSYSAAGDDQLVWP
ncbi:hypothetical protein KC318_g3852 [Hortaea werneckii]|uniref:Xylanolytic transcriptional activator regulatory domain-containing protein n=1 Tax=Hortaea werneckii TaxID=91943 RepID=A0A3M7AW10_HORWE|nr:hypothetical protein KC334_g4280 [Hortaea werneckii]KAI7016797.1 hypothetical protein KC355_g3872 [Hortaea werneckii]KAI7670787.1 hypothetical protein KC318_g3852 [Hortaea werneckii]RMY31725.1 hypothetical protein D0866_07098 [Hortaea werneckii]